MNIRSFSKGTELICKCIKFTWVKFIFDLVLFSLKNILVTINSVWLFKKIVEMVEDESVSFPEIFNLLIIMFVINLGFDLYEALYTSIYAQKLELYGKTKLMLWASEKANEIPMMYYENEEFHKKVLLAEKCINKTIWSVENAITQILGLLLAMISAIVVVNTINPFLNVFLLLLIPNMIISKYRVKMINKLNKGYVQYDNVIKHMFNYSMDKTFARKGRFSNLSDVAIKYVEEAQNGKKSIARQFSWKMILNYILNRFFSLTFVQIAVYGFAIYYFVLTNEFSIAEFSVLFVAVVNVLSRGNKIIAKADTVMHSLYEIEALVSFENTQKEKSGSNRDVPAFESIEFIDVCFKYKDRYVLNNASFKIKRGEKIAIVGRNGEGKTTILKLICRLYDPDSGKILYNGIDIQTFDIAAYRKKVSPVFQDFYVFAFSMLENVATEMNEEERTEIHTLFDKLQIGDFKQKLDKMMGKTLNGDGIILSGGNNKKLAIVRAMQKKSDILLFDEPDSDLDSFSVYDFMELVKSKDQNRLTLCVTHNMSVAKNMDRVIVIKDGRVFEDGNHRELVDLGGEYSTLFYAQASNYILGEDNA